jgi:hypothetical protein
VTKQIKILPIMLAILASSGLVRSQVGSSQVATKNLITVDSLDVMDAIPSDPVFELLGINGDQIVQPGTSKTFLSNLGSALDSKGNLKPGFGMTFAPVMLFDGQDQYYYNYATSWFERFKTNIQVSLGTAPSRRADSSIDFGFGVRFVFFNSGDGRLNEQYINNLVSAINRGYQKFNLNHLKKGDTYTPEMREEDSLMNSKLAQDSTTLNAFAADSGTNGAQKAREMQSKWGTSFLQLDIGDVFRNSGTYLSKSMWDRDQAILNGGFGWGWGQLLGQVGGIFRNTNPDYYGPDSASSIECAAQFKAGWDSFRLGFGARGTSGHGIDQGNLALAAEMKMSNDIWGLFSLTRDLDRGQLPGPWVPGITIKSTVGN